ncbi:MAG: hypothetical protein ACOX2G_03995 [Bacillota bacterium]|jgi:hypothetical protein
MRKIILVVLTLLLFLPLTIHGSSAFFTDTVSIPITISTDPYDDSWFVDYIFEVGDLNDLTTGNNEPIYIGKITSKVDDLELECDISGSITELHTCEFSSPRSFLLNVNDSQEIELTLKPYGNQKGKLFEGTVTIRFISHPEVEPITVNFEITVAR